MENIVVVGTGDVFQRFISPSLELLEYEGLIKTLTTIDIKSRARLEYLSENLEHRIRVSNEKLSSLLSDLRSRNPIVILAHDNDYHYQDTEDLVSNSFRVMLEKPYVTNKTDFSKLKELISKKSESVYLMDYYLMRKMSPLFLLSGALSLDGFYLTTESVFVTEEYGDGIKRHFGKLEEILEKPLSISVKILETSGDSGRLEQRGAHTFDTRRGGGMVQDMGIHALVPFFVLGNYLGQTDISFNEGIARTALSKEIYNFCKSNFTFSDEHIAETYAEIDFKTQEGIPVKIAVGKYVAHASAQKNLVITGTKGKIDLDMHENHLSVFKGHKLVDKIGLVNPKRSRYYPVIRTGLEFFAGRNPFSIDLSQTMLNSQELIFNILEKIPEKKIFYSNGEPVQNIFN